MTSRDTGIEGSEKGAATRDPRWPLFVMLAWAAGVVTYLLWFLAGRVGLWWIHRSARPLQDRAWIALVEKVSREMGAVPRVALYTSDLVHMAVTTGVIAPRVILPTTAGEWPEARRRSVLWHELAHVRRRDALVQVLARIATAIHCLNPLVWLAMRQLRIERERACDNAVLRSGAKPSDYATQLMEAAAELGAFRKPLWQTAATSEGSSLKDRLLCILDPDIRRGPTPKSSFALAPLLTFGLVAPLSAISVWTHDQGREPGPHIAIEARQEPTHLPGAHATRTETKTDERSAPGTGIPRKSRIEHLFGDLDSPDNQVRIGAVVALRELRLRETIPGLLKAVHDEYEEVRIVAVLALGALDDPRAVEGLRVALDDPAVRIRVAAVSELGNRRTRDAYDALVEASHNSSFVVRDAARAVLRRLGRSGSGD